MFLSFFSCMGETGGETGGGVLGELRPLWTEGERTPSEAGPVSWLVGGRSTGGLLIQQLVPRSALPDLGVPVAWGTHVGSIYLG